MRISFWEVSVMCNLGSLSDVYAISQNSYICRRGWKLKQKQNSFELSRNFKNFHRNKINAVHTKNCKWSGSRKSKRISKTSSLKSSLDEKQTFFSQTKFYFLHLSLLLSKLRKILTPVSQSMLQ